jgi:glycosyltransferase involved in cell wall biosynthesis
MAKKTKILFIFRRNSPFIEGDLNILREEFEVTPLQYSSKKDMFKLIRFILATQINVSWFSLNHATYAVLFSIIFRKKSIVIVGGWDVVSMPEIGYGAMINKSAVRKTRYSLERANKVIAVSKSTRNWVQEWVTRDDIITLYHGFDSNKYIPKGEKENIVVSVGGLANEVTIRVKGLETFAKAAKFLPDVKFIIIGKHNQKIADKWRNNASPNLEIIDFMPRERLIRYYQKAKVYAQLSYQESFGCAQAEAMLCECVPVSTRKGAIPEVVGDVGFFVDYGDAKGTANMIKRALISNKGSEARKRIMELFSLEDRKKKLIKTLDDCVKQR